MLSKTFGFASRIVALPDDAQCPECGWFDTTNPELVARMVQAGRKLWEAARPDWIECSTCGDTPAPDPRRR